MEGINIETALQNCGSAQLLREMFTSFYSEIDAKKEELTGLLNACDFENYRIKVHALKSAARIIGAEKLSELAAELEEAGKALQTKPLNFEELLSDTKSKTSLLLEQYRGLYTLLLPVKKYSETGAEEKRSLSSEERDSIIKK